MAHKMGLAKITLSSASVVKTKTYDGKTNSTSNSSNVSITASNAFTANKPYNHGTNTYYFIVKYNEKPILEESSSVIEAAKWKPASLTIQKDDSNALGQNGYKEFTIKSRAEVRGWQFFIANYDYQNSTMQFTAPVTGTYTVECWGAQGGDWGVDTGGKGGYATGKINTIENKIFYVCVGEAGKQGARNVAANWDYGYNGGGKLITGGSGSSGGGATHIAAGAIDRGELRNYASYKDEIVIVAGAGGGASSWPGDVVVSGTTYPAEYTFNGGYGGGIQGGSAEGVSAHINYVMHFYGGDQTGPVPGSTILSNSGNPSLTNTEGGFGYGGLGLGGGHCAGSGGSGWYGGTGAYDDGGGGGGSSWIASSWLLSNSGSTLAGDQNMIQPDGTTSKGHSGNGYARITFVSE